MIINFRQKINSFNKFINFKKLILLDHCMLNDFGRYNNKQVIHFGFSVTLVVILLGMFQDLVHSQVREYKFYVFESLLYKSYWTLFFPLSLLLIKYLNSLVGRSNVLNWVMASTLIGFATIIHLVLFPLLVVVLSDVLFTHTYNFNVVWSYTISEYLYICIGIYGMVGLFTLGSVRKKRLNDIKNPTLEILTIQKGTERILIKVDDIYCIQAESPYVAVYTAYRKFLYSDSLFSLSKQLDDKFFTRVHKSTIVHVQRVVSFTSRKNGDYDIKLMNGKVVRVSRTYAKNFKSKVSHIPS